MSLLQSQPFAADPALLRTPDVPVEHGLRWVVSGPALRERRPDLAPTDGGDAVLLADLRMGSPNFDGEVIVEVAGRRVSVERLSGVVRLVRATTPGEPGGIWLLCVQGEGLDAVVRLGADGPRTLYARLRWLNSLKLAGGRYALRG